MHSKMMPTNIILKIQRPTIETSIRLMDVARGDEVLPQPSLFFNHTSGLIDKWIEQTVAGMANKTNDYKFTCGLFISNVGQLCLWGCYVQIPATETLAKMVQPRSTVLFASHYTGRAKWWQDLPTINAGEAG